MGRRSLIDMVDHILRTAARMPWSGHVHRSHRPAQTADDARFSILGGGRWNVGHGDPDGRRPFPALYTATSPLISTWERLRHLDERSVGTMKASLRTALSQLEVTLPSVLDLRSPKSFGVDPAVLLGSDYGVSQAISAGAYDEGLGGLLVPTATGLGAADGDFNVVIFYETTGTSSLVYAMSVPDAAPRAGTVVRVLGTEEPNLPP
jgi:RES domain-containing protein